MSAPPRVMLDVNSPYFKTADEAANEVSRNFAQRKDIEQAAVIIRRPDGSFGYSTVSPQGHDDFAIAAQLPQGHSIGGIVHSHPGAEPMAQVFSPQDIAMSNQLKVPSYIRFLNDNSIRQYIPGTTKTQNRSFNSGDRFGLKTATGDPLVLPPPGPLSPQGAAVGALASMSPEGNP